MYEFYVIYENAHDIHNIFDNSFLDIENIDHVDSLNHFDIKNKNLKMYFIKKKDEKNFCIYQYVYFQLLVHVDKFL
jgi:hypothetical protein